MSNFQAGLGQSRSLWPDEQQNWCSTPLKRLLDLAISAPTALIFAVPFGLICCGLVLSGVWKPLFFQWREGRNGRPFRIIKFRTMQRGRITRLGRFLRRTSLDEIPQLYNVLKGDMSLVGPRPHIADMRAGGMTYRELVPGYDRRLKIRPGLTGLAQSRGLRGPADDPLKARARIDADLEYLRTASLSLDLAILIATAGRQFLTGHGE